MRVLVTGATGLVAGRLCRQLPARGHMLIAQSRTTGEHRCELGDVAAVEALFASTTPDVVIHPAGMTDVDACERDPEGARRANVDSVRNLARAAKRIGAQLLSVSTDYVFDGKDGPYREDAPPSPVGVYARTKHEGEQIALAEGFAVARTATVYGWPPAGGRLNFGAWLVTKLKAGERVRLFNDQLVSPSWAESVAAMLIDVAEMRRTGVWHLSGADVVDRVTFGERLAGVFGLDASLIDAVPMASVCLPMPRPKRAGLLIGKAASLPHPPLSLSEALEQFRREVQSGDVRRRDQSMQ